MSKPCTITRAEFASRAHATEPVTIAGQVVLAGAKEFSTGSLGYYANGKVYLEIAGQRVLCQVGCTITIVGSKELPQDSTPQSQAA